MRQISWRRRSSQYLPEGSAMRCPDGSWWPLSTQYLRLVSASSWPVSGKTLAITFQGLMPPLGACHCNAASRFLYRLLLKGCQNPSSAIRIRNSPRWRSMKTSRPSPPLTAIRPVMCSETGHFAARQSTHILPAPPDRMMEPSLHLWALENGGWTIAVMMPPHFKGLQRFSHRFGMPWRPHQISVRGWAYHRKKSKASPKSRTAP